MKRLAIFALCLVTPLNSLAENYSILILSNSGSTHTKTITKNITADLAATNIQIKTPNSYETTNLNNYDLIVTIGSQSAKSALQDASSTPVLSLLIPEIVANSIENKNNKTWASQVLDQPLDRQLQLIKHITGKNIKIGILLGPRSSRNRNRIEQAAKEIGIPIKLKTIQTSEQLIPALKDLINQSDVLLSIPDSVVYQKKTIRGILLLTFRKKIPVIGYSKSFVKAGAATGVYSTPEQIARDASDNIKNFFKSNKKFKHEILYPRSYSIDFNEKIITSLKLKRPDKNLILNSGHNGN